MVKSLYSGVSGLKTHQQRMDVIGNNIANVNTVGFKTSVVTFADVYYQTKKTASGATSSLGGVNPRQVGYGVKMSTTTPNMSQSGFTYSDSIYDIAIDGEGFIQLMDGSGNLLYTRTGSFSIDDQGYLVNSSGYHVLGVSGDSEGQPASSEIIRFVIPETQANTSKATKLINGTNVTISMSAPSDVSDMSVTFTNSEFPYATYSSGILNIFMNMDEQYESEADFQTAINNALQAGGINLPDDLELNFEFESIPSSPEAVIAKNSIDSWKVVTTSSTCDEYKKYKYIDKDGEEASPSKSAQIAFSCADTSSLDTVKVIYDEDAPDKATVVYTAPDTAKGETAGTWTITVNAEAGQSDINEKINNCIADYKDAKGVELSKLSCTSFVFPEGGSNEAKDTDKEQDNRRVAFEAIGGKAKDENTDPAITMKLKGYTSDSNTTLGISVEAKVAGEYANNYKIVFAYSSTYGTTKAVWDENTLTITVGNDSTLQDIQKAVTEAANGNEKKKLTITGMSGLNDLNAAARKALFGGNPSISLANGADSFFTEVANSLSTFNLQNGRTGSEQSVKDLEDVTIQNDGTIIGTHAILGRITLGRIDLAMFDNPNGLSAVGGTCFVETVASGEAKLSIAGGTGAGSIISGALEMSNVDLAQEFTDLITTQRGYQANSRVITTSDTMLEELLSLKR